MLKSSERSISLVKGGQARYAAALAWERKGSLPGHKIFNEWLESAKNNPVVIDFEVSDKRQEENRMSYCKGQSFHVQKKKKKEGVVYFE